MTTVPTPAPAKPAVASADAPEATGAVPATEVARDPRTGRFRWLPRFLHQLHWRTWRGVVWRSINGFIDDECDDLAAALTYNSVLALFPVAIVVVALVNLVTDGSTAVGTILGILRDLGAGAVISDPSFTDVLNAVVVQQSSAKVLLGFGLLGALWWASNYVGTFTRASNRIYGVKEGRPWWKLLPLQVGLSAIALVLMAAVATALVISGPLVDAVGNALGVGDGARLAWSIGRWPVLVLILMVLLSMLFWIAPNVRQPRFRWLTVGGAVALAAWAVASFGFGLYVSNFGSYDKTYGSLGAIIAFLVWLYWSNSAILFGVELNAEVARGRQMQAGNPDPDPPLLQQEPVED